MIVKYLIIQRVTVKNWFCTFLLAQKGTQKRRPQSPPDRTGKDIQPDCGKEP